VNKEIFNLIADHEPQMVPTHEMPRYKADLKRQSNGKAKHWIRTDIPNSPLAHWVRTGDRNHNVYP
jgi:hypothetical protein